jgi:ABC-type protease/lipase transport system fused ATPase/permease subunit
MAMTPFSLAAFIKFLIGIFLLQGATALLLMSAQDADLNKSGWLFGALGLLIGVIAAFWFTSITSHARQHSLIKVSEKYQRQRDRIMRQAEKEKTRQIRNSHQQLLRETRRVQSRSTLKLGAALTGVVGLGVLLLFTQFMMLGVLAVSATGGALLGYGIRARQYPVLGRSPDAAAGNLPARPAGQGRVLAGEKVAQDGGD